MVLYLVTVTKWSTIQSTNADTNYCSANLKYAEGYAKDMLWTYIHCGLPCKLLILPGIGYSPWSRHNIITVHTHDYYISTRNQLFCIIYDLPLNVMVWLCCTWLQIPFHCFIVGRFYLAPPGTTNFPGTLAI